MHGDGRSLGTRLHVRSSRNVVPRYTYIDTHVKSADVTSPAPDLMLEALNTRSTRTPDSGLMADPVDILDDLDTYLARVSSGEEEKTDLGDACTECKTSPSPLVSATTSCHRECLTEMLSIRAVLGRPLASVRGESDATLAHLAARRGDRETLKILLTADQSLCTIGDVRGATPLHVCAYHGYADCLTFLLERGSQPNHRDQDGATAVHFAASSGHLGCLKELVHGGSGDPNAQTNTGETPGS